MHKKYSKTFLLPPYRTDSCHRVVAALMRPPRASASWRPGGTTWGTNRGLGGGGREGSHLDHSNGGGMSQGKRDPKENEKGHLGGRSYRQGCPSPVIARLPQSSAFGIPGGHEVAFGISVRKDFKGFKASVSSVLSTKRFLSGADRKGEGFTAGGEGGGCPLKDADRPRGASGGSLSLDTWTPPSHPDCSLFPSKHPSDPRSGLPAVGVCGGVCEHCIGVNSPTIHPPPALPIRVNTFPCRYTRLPTHTHSKRSAGRVMKVATMEEN